MRKSVVYALSLVCAIFVITAIFLAKGYRVGIEIFTGSVADEYEFIETSCWFDIPPEKDIRCGELRTPTTTGEFILPVVRIIEGSHDRRADPIIYLQGGPGASAQLDNDGIRYWLDWLSYADFKRDFILMDPRGVGRSKPALTCDTYDQFSLSVLRQNLTQHQELEQGYIIVEQCFKDLAQRGFKPDHYGTEIAAQDLRALMSRLSLQNHEYQYWNLLGVSYGTRVAMAAANDFPAVRALILDSVYPAGYGGLQSWPQLFDQSLRNFFVWCAAEQVCKSADGVTMLERLSLALQTLRAHPVTMHIPRWNGEAPIDLVLNDYRFLSAIFSALYSKHEWMHISAAIDAAIVGERAGLQTLVETFINNAFSDAFFGLAFMAVDCRDHPVAPEVEYKNILHRYPMFAEYTGDLWQYQACHFLTGAEGLHSVPPLDQPALLLAGTLDPITPVIWAQEIHQQSSASQLVVLEGVGHAVINSSACVHERLREFLDSPQTSFPEC